MQVKLWPAVLLGMAIVGPVTFSGAQTAEYAEPAAIPIPVTLEAPGYLTLVIEDGEGRRVRNLVQQTWFEAGSHTLLWDGYDEGEPVGMKGKASPYDIARRPVGPGTYYVRGLTHAGIRPIYEFSVQSPGTPPWMNAGGTGGWLADHTPPSDVLYLPDGSPHGPQAQMLVASYAGENGHGAVWIDAATRGKLFGSKPAGWGALKVARDAVAQPSDVQFYFIRPRKKSFELYAYRVGGQSKQLAAWPLEDDFAHPERNTLSLAVRGGVAVVTDTRADRLYVYRLHEDAAERLGELSLGDPRGVAFDAEGRLLVAAGRSVHRYTLSTEPVALQDEEVLIGEGVDEPVEVQEGPEGCLYVADWGASHQVKVFCAEPGGIWRLDRAVGAPGGPALGPYDELRMHHPAGFALDGEGKLWVAEADYAPKRLSIWDAASGELVEAIYGPPKYGGGGTLDPVDSTRFYYTGASRELQIGYSFHLDWETGRSKPEAIYYDQRLMPETALRMPGRAPERPIYAEGHAFMVNPQGNAQYNTRAFGIWRWDGPGRLVPVGAFGLVQGWRSVLGRGDLVARRPRGNAGNTLFAWADLDGDEQVSAQEVQYHVLRRPKRGGFSFVAQDLAVLTTGGSYVPPPRIRDDGVPVYDLSAVELRIPGDGLWGQSLLSQDGRWAITTRGPVRGYQGGDLQWTYHSQWPNRAGRSPVPEYPGQLIETGRLLGPAVRPPEGEAGEVWAINGDRGEIYLLTVDGLFLATLGADQRVAPPWAVDTLGRGDAVEGLSLRGEMFWPTMTQVASGAVYVVAGHEHSSLLRLEGFASVRRLPPYPVDVGLTAKEGGGAPEVERALGAARSEPLRVGRHAARVDGALEEWPGASWVDVDARQQIAAAVSVAGDTLYVAFRTSDPALLDNALPDGWRHAFATGGALDVMLGSPKAATRVVVTRRGDPVEGEVVALLLSTAGQAPFAYESPVRSVTLARVEDVSAQVRLAQRGATYELALPLSLFPEGAGEASIVAADVGVILGGSGEAQARFYWSNKRHTMVNDVPSEAELVPDRWGRWVLGAEF